MDIKDKLNLAWKFLFLAVFTYGVMSLTCCSSNCGSNACCKSESSGNTIKDERAINIQGQGRSA